MNKPPAKAFPRKSMDFPIINYVPKTPISNKLDAIYISSHLQREKYYDVFLKNLHYFTDEVFIISENRIDTPSWTGDYKFLDYDDQREMHFLLQKQSSDNPSRLAMSNYNLPAKRNKAINHALSENLNKIMLLDDDTNCMTV